MFIQQNNILVDDGSNVLNGAGQGQVGGVMDQCYWEPRLLRPFINRQGVPVVTVQNGRKNDGTPIFKTHRIADLAARGIWSPVFNATSLRKEDWIQLDRAVLLAARQRLRAWRDLAAANSFGGFNAMSKTTLEYEAMSDPGEAIVDMDGLTQGRTDNPLFKLRSIPLPITHSDFHFSSRRLAVSRNSTPLDTTMAEAAGRRVAELIEKTTLGVVAGLAYGYQSTGVTAHDSTYGSQIYGYTNFPSRVSSTSLTTPDGTNSDTTLAEVLEMRDALYAKKFYGPFMLYHSDGWDQFMDNDYGVTAGSSYGFAPSQTLRNRLRAIDGIQDVRRLDFLTSDYQLIMVQMTSDVARAINGMGITTVQWESMGGMRLNFKVMAIQVPQLRADYNDNCGIAHYSTS